MENNSGSGNPQQPREEILLWQYLVSFFDCFHSYIVQDLTFTHTQNLKEREKEKQRTL